MSFNEPKERHSYGYGTVYGYKTYVLDSVQVTLESEEYTFYPHYGRWDLL